jgi:hypothetical protein
MAVEKLETVREGMGGAGVLRCAQDDPSKKQKHWPAELKSMSNNPTQANGRLEWATLGKSVERGTCRGFV